jgi:DNA/RNA-binding domain of Phe-tRNA-synthetase-like protein
VSLPPDSEPEADGPPLRRGWIAPAVAEEFPQLAVIECELPLPADRRSPRGVRAQLDMLSNRHRGGTALALRREPVAGAYRVFFRHIGLEPDVTRTPVEAAVLERLMRGGFESRGLIEDALLMAVVQTSVPVWALDADRREGTLGIRAAGEDERLGRQAGAPRAGAGRLVVADERSALAVLFGPVASGHEVARHSRRAALFSVQVAGVPFIHVDEALWLAASTITGTETGR